jgi:hypothetical protein
LSTLLSRISDIPEEAVVHANVEPHESNPEFSTALQNAQLNTSRRVYALIRAGVLGDDAGAHVSAAAPTAALVTVAGIARAAAEKAISDISDVASRSVAAGVAARLSYPALGATVPGLSIAAGTGLVMGLVVFPVVAAAAGAALGSGARLLAKQVSIQEDLDDAERVFDENARVVREFVDRASKVSEILTVAVLASRYHMRTLESAVPDGSGDRWSALDPSTQSSIRRMAEIMLASVTVIGLPIGLNLERAAPMDPFSADAVNDNSMPQVEPVLGVAPESESEFIDYAIAEAFAQVAR